MNLNYIEAFYYVAKLGSISQAARHLTLTQPTVTQKIRMLEEEVGVSLITRGARGVRLTEKGKIFFDHASRVVEEVEGLQSQFFDTKTNALKILSSQGIGSYILPDVLTDLFKGTDLDMEINSMSNLSPLDIEKNDVYIGPFIEGLEKTHKVKHAYDFKFSLYASEDYLKKAGQPTSTKDLKSHSLICFTDDQRTAFHETDFTQLLTEPDFKNPQIRVNSVVSEIKLASNSQGIALLSDEAVQYFKPSLVKVNLAEFDQMKIPSYFFIKKDLGRDKVEFIQKLYNSFQSYITKLS